MVGKGGLPPLVECHPIVAGASRPSQPARLSNLTYYLLTACLNTSHQETY